MQLVPSKNFNPNPTFFAIFVSDPGGGNFIRPAFFWVRKGRGGGASNGPLGGDHPMPNAKVPKCLNPIPNLENLPKIMIRTLIRRR